MGLAPPLATTLLATLAAALAALLLAAALLAAAALLTAALLTAALLATRSCLICHETPPLVVLPLTGRTPEELGE